VKVEIKSRKVAVKGRKGELAKDFSHIPCELQMMKQNEK
jgi:ribosomal protein L6P/L9E